MCIQPIHTVIYIAKGGDGGEEKITSFKKERKRKVMEG